MQVITQNIALKNTTIQLDVRREDLIHPFVSGNKIRKLKYNLIQAQAEQHHQILTFGGAFSNHIAATAYAASENNMKSIGIIRGDELKNKPLNPTLRFAQSCGMQLEFVMRERYRLKTSADFSKQLSSQFGRFYLLPEGGTNSLAVKGCSEILNASDTFYDYICCCVGTGGTISGICNGAFKHQKILGFPALKGNFLQKDICKFATKFNWELITDYHFGGYAKVTSELIDFINQFYLKNQILLDPIYTAKMAFGVMDLINTNYFPENSKILLIHSGGLQAISGMNEKLKQKNATLITTYV